MKKFLSRVKVACCGIQSAFLSEANFRLQLVAALSVTVILVARKASPIWCAVVALTVGSVLTAEMFNTALEKLVDHLHPEKHPSIKIVKDCAAGAVLILSLASLVVAGAFVFSEMNRL